MLIEYYHSELIVASFLSALKAIIDKDFLTNNKFSLKEAIRYTFDIQLNGILTNEGRKKYKKDKNRIKL